MANFQFEEAGDAKHSSADDAANQAHSAFHAEFMTVSDKGQTDEKSAGGDRRVGKDQAQAQAGSEKDLTKSEQMLQGAIKEFEAAPDKKAALKQLSPKFEDAIKQADTDFEKLGKSAMADLQKLKPEMDKVEPQIEAAGKKVANAFQSEVPKADQEKVAAKVEQYIGLDPKDPARKALAADLGKYPTLMGAVAGLEKVVEDNRPLIEKVSAIQEQVQQAVIDRYQTRVGYALALHAGGDDVKAKQIYKEAQKIVGQGQEEEEQPPQKFKFKDERTMRSA